MDLMSATRSRRAGLPVEKSDEEDAPTVSGAPRSSTETSSPKRRVSLDWAT